MCFLKIGKLKPAGRSWLVPESFFLSSNFFMDSGTRLAIVGPSTKLYLSQFEGESLPFETFQRLDSATSDSQINLIFQSKQWYNTRSIHRHSLFHMAHFLVIIGIATEVFDILFACFLAAALRFDSEKSSASCDYFDNLSAR